MEAPNGDLAPRSDAADRTVARGARERPGDVGYAESTTMIWAMALAAVGAVSVGR